MFEELAPHVCYKVVPCPSFLQLSGWEEWSPCSVSCMPTRSNNPNQIESYGLQRRTREYTGDCQSQCDSLENELLKDCRSCKSHTLLEKLTTQARICPDIQICTGGRRRSLTAQPSITRDNSTMSTTRPSIHTAPGIASMPSQSPKSKLR